jgi:penicillin-binding protein 2
MQLCTSGAGVGTGLVNASTLWIDSGVLKVDNYTILCPSLVQTNFPHISLTLETALDEKCDVFFGKLAQLLRLDRYTAYESLLGFGQETGIELSEEEGRASSIATDSDAALLKAALGEGDTVVTPAQLCAMLSSIVGGGKRYSSHLLYEVRNFTSGDVTQKVQPTLLSEYALGTEGRALLLNSMSNIMKNYSGLNVLYHDLFAAGVQTGCFGSSVPSGNGGRDHAVMLAYGVPRISSISSKTGICVTVIVENGGNEAVAAPVVEAVLEQFYK